MTNNNNTNCIITTIVTIIYNITIWVIERPFKGSDILFF